MLLLLQITPDLKRGEEPIFFDLQSEFARQRTILNKEQTSSALV
jgi:hypothetical protein